MSRSTYEGRRGNHILGAIRAGFRCEVVEEEEEGRRRGGREGSGGIKHLRGRKRRP